ncbi:hypothetical protein F5887DRAFT_970899 [Amanita rubescens]|nr:hypothetical protein F5887DRAFT_970899 [Amanita rubescens]
MANSAHDYDSNSRLNLFDWAHARYWKVPGIGAPPSNWLEAFYWPGKSGGLPLPPKPIPENLGTKGFSLLPTLEKNIINDKPVYLWGNAEANYYKLHKLVDGFPAVVKVSWVEGSRKHQYLYHEITNLIAVKGLLAGGQLRVDGAREISVVYFVMKFQGEMEVKGLTPERREELKQEAMERYKTDFGMVNTHPIDKYFIYGKDIDNKLKAYIYDWSSARHVDLPDGTLDYICPLPNKGYEDLRRIENEYCSKDAARKSQHIKA